MNNLFGDTGHKSYINSNGSNTYSVENLSPQELYSKLKEYYDNSEHIYGDAQSYGYYANLWIDSIKPVRTVVNRSVEFYVSKIAPGDISQLEINTDNQQVLDSISQLWKWSNFGAQKQVAVRDLALYGDLFMKVASNQDKIFIEIIEPGNVTSFNADKRGNLTEIRIDVPQADNKTYTEYWNKADGYYSIWTHNQGSEIAIDQLGTPTDSGYLAEFGIDFIPFVHIKFKDTGELRGKSCVYHAISKIDEANRQATRLAQMLFRWNKPLLAVSANATDKDGRPIPAPKIKTGTTSGNDLELKENQILYLPGTSTIQSLIPDVNYSDALAILKDQMNEIEMDLPELRYYSMQDSTLSGKAIKLLLAGAVDRAEEARGNFLSGLTRIDEMALTIGKYFNLFPATIGSYENDDFSHTIEPVEMFPVDEVDRATLVQAYVGAGLAVSSALRLAGFSEDAITQIMDEKGVSDTNNQNALANSLMSFNKNGKLPTTG